MFKQPHLTTLSKLEQFFKTARLLHYKKRDIIQQAHDTTSSVFYIKSGYLRVYRISEQGEELTVTILKPGDFFPLTYGISMTSNPYYLEAITSLELWKAQQELFLAFVKSNPDVLYDLTSRILIKFDGALSRIEYLIFSNAYIKVATTLLICAKKFGEPIDESVVVQVPLTHHDIATLVGITRETTSLEIKKLEKKGYLGKKGKLFVIKNIKQLEEEIYLATQEKTPINYSL